MIAIVCRRSAIPNRRMWPELAGIYGDNFVVFFPQISFLSSAAKREAKPSFHVAPPADLAAAGRKVREMKRSHQKEPSALLIGRAPTAATAAPLGGSTPLGDRVIRNTAIRFTIRLCATSFDLFLFFKRTRAGPDPSRKWPEKPSYHVRQELPCC